MFISGLDDREKILLDEYTSVLMNYKDVRMKLNDVEKKNRDSIFELTLQVSNDQCIKLTFLTSIIYFKFLTSLIYN